MKYVLVIKSIDGKYDGLVSEFRESNEPIIKTTLLDYLNSQSNWGKHQWQREEGHEDSNYVEYTTEGKYAAFYMKNNSSYSVSSDDSLWFIGDVLCGRKRIANA